MKKLFLIATALAALVSCTNNDFVGDTPQPTQNGDGAIAFGSGLNAVTRDSYTGGEAAQRLNYKFVVGGFKGATSVATTTVFDNYNVEYTANTANTTESNTNNWEYVGLAANSLSTITGAGTQTIKYWDYSQNQYDFIAYSLGEGGATATTITPSTATDYEQGGAYTIAGTTAQLKTVHIADLVTVKKADYSKVVNLTFRGLISKVRMGIYETVPGYSVRDVKFYTSDAAITGGSTSTTAALYSSTALPTGGTYTIYFPTVNKQSTDATAANYNTDSNKAHVAFTSSTSTQTNQTFGTLTNLVKRERLEYLNADTNPDKLEFLGRTSNASTYAGDASVKYYQDVLPLETGASLTLKVDYTLVSIDGSKETIKVVGAKAVVPAIYAQWKPGYAYTYLFKISDNTNGYTSGVENSEVSGLHAITFDAVVVNAEADAAQETVTTVATPSITTYQHDPAINVSENNEYVAGTVYAMVMQDGTLKNDLNSSTKPAQLFLLDRSATEAEVMDALLMQSSVSSGTITGRNGLVLTPQTSNIDNTITEIPGADGNDIKVDKGTASELTVAAGNNYAYVYTVTAPDAGTPTNKYEVANLTAGETIGEGYFTKNAISGEYETASGTVDADTVYYVHVQYTTYVATYAVKVIKVKS
jgi:hypothetical protein